MKDRGVAFYCVADADYFIGLVGLVNSLRLQGHDEPLYVLDRGLLPWQRRRLEAYATLVQDHDDDDHPILSKTHAPLRYPAQTMVLLDSDMIVTRSLAPLVETAATGRIVAFADAIDRFMPEWASHLGLPALTRMRYVNSGFFAFSREVGIPLLERVREAHGRIQLGGSRLGSGTPSDAFYFPDQDAWNAVLASTVDPQVLHILENRLAPFPPFEGVVAADGDAPRCRSTRGEEPPYLLHCIGRKPWLAPTSRTVYTELLTRLLLSPNGSVQVREREIPWRLRRGLVAEGAGLVAEGSAWLAGKRGKLGVRPRVSSAMSELRKWRYSDVG
jgi:hypothetical protein